MKKKIIFITIILCIIFAVIGFFLSQSTKSTKPKDTAELIITDTKSSSTDTQAIYKDGKNELVFETVPTANETNSVIIVPAESDTDNSVKTTDNNRIYVDENDNDSPFSGGYFSWK